MQIYEEEETIKGKSFKVAGVRVDNNVITIPEKFIKIARVKDEWYADVRNPEAVIAALKNSKVKADIFTFWQRLPETQPKYNYYMEWDNVAAMPVTSYEHWYKTQINRGVQGKIRHARKSGVIVEKAEFNDDFVKGMESIFNETPFRQGRPFWHYGKDFETIKREFSRCLYREDIIGAYYNDELIGFVFLADAGEYALPAQIISKIEHRDKAPSNALIAKAVEICGEKKIPYLVYFNFDSGAGGNSSLTDFKERNGFKKVLLPRYYVPLTGKGEIILKLGLHRGIKGMLPEKLATYLLDLRAKWYSYKRGIPAPPR